jgi:hypothetical protein
VFLPVALLTFAACSDDDGGTSGPPNNPPTVPENPSPAHQLTDGSPTTLLTWEATDPEGASLTYNVYFGTTNPPPLVASGIDVASYNPGTLQFATTYYWNVEASDGARKTMGPVWSFATYLNPGYVTLSTVSSGDNCNIFDAAGPITVYVVHTGTQGATAIQFSAPVPACASSVTYVADTPVFPVTIGNSQTGVSIGYGQCLAAPVHVMTISLMGAGTTGTCCPFAVMPDPNNPSGNIEVVDCNSNMRPATGAISMINPVTSCMCTPSAASPNTWQRIRGFERR